MRNDYDPSRRNVKRAKTAVDKHGHAEVLAVEDIAGLQDSTARARRQAEDVRGGVAGRGHCRRPSGAVPELVSRAVSHVGPLGARHLERLVAVREAEEIRVAFAAEVIGPVAEGGEVAVHDAVGGGEERGGVADCGEGFADGQRGRDGDGCERRVEG